MENEKKLTDEELDQISGGIEDSEIPYIFTFEHTATDCKATFAALSKPEKCPVCGRPDSPESPIIALW